MIQALHDLYLRYKWRKEGDWDSLLHYFYQEEIYDIAIDTVSDHFPNAGVYKSAVLVTYLLERLDRESLEFKKQLLT